MLALEYTLSLLESGVSPMSARRIAAACPRVEALDVMWSYSLESSGIETLLKKYAHQLQGPNTTSLGLSSKQQQWC
jgi:hypothetical protein